MEQCGRHGKALLGLQHHPGLDQVVKRVTAGSLSVRQTEALVHSVLIPDGQKKEPKAEVPIDPNVKEVAERLQRGLGLKVRIEDTKGRGKVIIEYSSLADFDGLLEKFGTDH